MQKSTMRMLMVIALLVGFTACAKYPVVLNASTAAPAPTAASHTPAR